MDKSNKELKTENEALKKKVEELEKKEVDYLLTPKADKSDAFKRQLERANELEQDNKNLYASIGNLKEALKLWDEMKK